MTDTGTRVRARYDGGLAVYAKVPGVDATAAPPTRVVFVHGAMDRAASFIRTVRRRPELGVVRYDRRGYGRSVDVGFCRDLDEQVDDLLTVIDGRPSVVIGHSLGGLIALAAATRDPDLVRSVGAFEAPLWTDDHSSSDAERDRADAEARSDPALAAERFMRRMIGDEAWLALPDSTRRTRRAEGPALVSDLASVRAAGRDLRLDEVAVPVLAGCASASSERHRQSAARLAHRTAHGMLVTIDGAGHDAHRTHPDDFARFVDHAIELADGAAQRGTAVQGSSDER